MKFFFEWERQPFYIAKKIAQLRGVDIIANFFSETIGDTPMKFFPSSSRHRIDPSVPLSRSP